MIRAHGLKKKKYKEKETVVKSKRNNVISGLSESHGRFPTPPFILWAAHPGIPKSDFSSSFSPLISDIFKIAVMTEMLWSWVTRMIYDWVLWCLFFFKKKENKK